MDRTQLLALLHLLQGFFPAFERALLDLSKSTESKAEFQVIFGLLMDDYAMFRATAKDRLDTALHLYDEECPDDPCELRKKVDEFVAESQAATKAANAMLPPGLLDGGPESLGKALAELLVLATTPTPTKEEMN